VSSQVGEGIRLLVIHSGCGGQHVGGMLDELGSAGVVVVRCLFSIALCSTNDEHLEVGMFREGERKFNISFDYLKRLRLKEVRILTTYLLHRN
jgi:hypothetical protein